MSTDRTDPSPAPGSGERSRSVPGDPGPVIGRILLLDDDALLRRTTASLLTEAGHDVRDAQDASAALDLLGDDRGFDLAIVDYSMPDMSGDEFAQAARAKHPKLPVLFMTGYAGAASLAGERWYVHKPFRRGELLSLVAEALAGAGNRS